MGCFEFKASQTQTRERDLYARFGVPEYWVGDPAANRVEVYKLHAGGDEGARGKSSLVF